MEKEIENKFKQIERQIQTLDKYLEVGLMLIAILGIFWVIFLLSNLL